MGLFDRWFTPLDAPSTRETIESLMEKVEELGVTNQLLTTQAETLAWTVIGERGKKNELAHVDRVSRNELAEHLYRENETIRRAVNLRNEYVLGRGMRKPVAVSPYVQRVIDSFWDDDTNKRVLTTLAAMVNKGTDVQLHGELFFVVFETTWQSLGIEVTKREPSDERLADGRSPDPNKPAATAGIQQEMAVFEAALMESEHVPSSLRYSFADDLSGGDFDVKITGELPPSAIRLSQIHPNEITRIIFDEEDGTRPRHYRRTYTPVEYDFTKDQVVTDLTVPTEEVVKYYEDRLYPPLPDQPLPPENKVAEGKILHFKINTNSFDERGHSDVWVVAKWVAALEQFFVWRLTLLKALATIPFKRKIKGGRSAVIQSALALVNETNPGATGVPGARHPYTPPAVGAILTENENSSLEQMKTDPGSASAGQDVTALRSMVATGLGLSVPYIGDPNTGTLSNQNTMETPILKGMEARQEFFEGMVETILDLAIAKAVEDGQIPEGEDLSYKNDLPNILQRNIPELVNAINQIADKIDPYSVNFKLKRFILLQGLTYLGVANPYGIVAQLYPRDAEEEELRRMQIAQYGFDPNNPEGTPLADNSQNPPSGSVLDPLRNLKQRSRGLEEADLLPTDAEIDAELGKYEKAFDLMFELLTKMGAEELEKVSAISGSFSNGSSDATA